ncbi:tetraspanin-33-like isoform X2 [Mya arenaria]|uniref:tetraspanin-33-like isoform X2 n=1 Tax=Mya arenaria TaxID=6604 RepID=UPI0022E3366D|nr:tetraspanin-33-like isoform X2 [Mya arenaria]
MKLPGQDSSEVNLVSKYVLFFVNFLICIVALAVVALMTYVLVVKEKKVEEAYDFFLDPSCILCLFGCVALLASLVGWWGPFRENVGVLRAYVWMMTILFFLQIAFVIIIFVAVYSPEAQKALHLYPDDALNKAVVQYWDDDDLRDLVNYFQETFACCGTSDNDEGYKDWAKNEYYNCSVSELQKKSNPLFCSVPYSCCFPNEGGLKDFACGLNMQSDDIDPTVRAKTIYTKGCFKSIADIMRDNVLVVGAVLIGIFIPQLIMTWMARTLIGQIRVQRQKWNQRPR